MEIPGGWGSETKAPFVGGGMDIFWNYTFQVVLVILPPSPGISVIIQLGWVSPGKNICVKNVVTLYYYAKDSCFLR